MKNELTKTTKLTQTKRETLARILKATEGTAAAAEVKELLLNDVGFTETAIILDFARAL